MKKHKIDTGTGWRSSGHIGVAFSTLQIAALLAAALGLHAQTFTTLYSFDSTGEFGAKPAAGLIAFVNGGVTLLCGTAQAGGTSGDGTVFELGLGIDGGIGRLASFTGGIDGASPYAGLVFVPQQQALYGTTSGGVSGNTGTLFALGTLGGNVLTLHTFTGGSDGANPYGELVVSGDGILYGTTLTGGDFGYGTVFSLGGGEGFATLYSFTGNSDGGNPVAGLLLSGNTLYGTTSRGGSSYDGTVFAINTDGTGFTTLHQFVGGWSDGASPYGGLVLGYTPTDTEHPILFGTTAAGGGAGTGTVFAISPDGGGFTVLHSFRALHNSTNTDGASPQAGLFLSGFTLYGTAYAGGTSGNGTVFSINTDGSEFVTLHDFTGPYVPIGFLGTNSDGAQPYAGLILGEEDLLYGTASGGGSSGNGTVFSLQPSVPAQFTSSITVAITATMQGVVKDNGRTSTYTTTHVILNDAALLKQLAIDENAEGNYEATTFPSGARLWSIGGAFQVLAKNGTPLVDVSDIMSSSTVGADVVSGSLSDTTGAGTTTDRRIMTLTFDDSFVNSANPITISLSGLLTRTRTVSNNQTETDSASLQNAAGVGTIGGANAILTGTFNSRGNGISSSSQ